jgi:polyisoprenoid-binding protein YceI
MMIPFLRSSSMTVRMFRITLAVVLFAAAAPAARADDYAVDAAHAAAVFRVSHIGLSWTYGRFKDLTGTFAVDPRNPAGTRFDLSARVDSVDTDNAKRDEHLKSPDFFAAKQFPMVGFRSTAVKPVEGGYEVAAELTLHGVTKPVTVVLKGGRAAEFPKGVQRTGYVGEFTIKRSDFGMTKMLEGVGDEINVQLSFEGTKK